MLDHVFTRALIGTPYYMRWAAASCQASLGGAVLVGWWWIGGVVGLMHCNANVYTVSSAKRVFTAPQLLFVNIRQVGL